MNGENHPSFAVGLPTTEFKSASTSHTTTANGRPVKRRASKACQCCRARKVRCNVVEHGAPCTNCRLDEVDCVVTESKRRKKHHYAPKLLDPITENIRQHVQSHPDIDALVNGSVNPLDITNPIFRRSSESSSSIIDEDEHHMHQHVPHSLYQTQCQKLKDTARCDSFASSAEPPFYLHQNASIHNNLLTTGLHTPSPPMARTFNGPLPPYIKPLPPRMTVDDVQYLYTKGALSIPDTTLRNALLQSYIEYVHPYMPLIELHDFLRTVNQKDGEDGKISLILFQTVMFAGTGFVDNALLNAAGFPSRKVARKAFYLKARLLYDFDYEFDRVSLIQSLLLMTYWYETPDDQKDTWHWMGVAVSLAHTVGLQRNPEKSNMDIKKQRLWKRLWWSCFMRDRIIALGMRRPTRIKDEDFDVPMLQLEDFEIQALASDNLTISTDCVLIRDVTIQADLAKMCIAKAKLCVIISHVLSAQHSVLLRDQGTAQGYEGNTRLGIMLSPRKLEQTDEVKQCDQELAEWIDGLDIRHRYRTPTPEDIRIGRSSFVVQLALLHMVYCATVSALHRPLVLPSADASNHQCGDFLDLSRKKVREASREITRISVGLQKFNLERFLPTSGVTVILPAIIIHLLDIKSSNGSTRDSAIKGFRQCMAVLDKLCDNYAAADYAIQFLEAAIRKADIDVGSDATSACATPDDWSKNLPKTAQSVPQVLDADRTARLAPSPEKRHENSLATEASMQHFDTKQEFATTPPGSDSSNTTVDSTHDDGPMSLDVVNQFDDGFDALIDYGADLEGIEDWSAALDEGMHRESGGFMMDMDWMKEGGGERMGGIEYWGGTPFQTTNGLSKEEDAIFLLRGAG